MCLYLTRDHPESENGADLILWTEKPKIKSGLKEYLPSGGINSFMFLRGDAEQFFLKMIKRAITYEDGVFVLLSKKVAKGD